MEEQPITIGYWRIRGLGAPIIYLCEHLGLPYRLHFYEQGGAPDFSKEAFRRERETLGVPFADLPYIIDGPYRVAQSPACLRHLCRRHAPDLLGRDLAAQALVETTAQILHEDRIVVHSLSYRNLDQAVAYDEAHARLARFEAHMQGRAWIADVDLTYVDFVLWEYIDFANWLSSGATAQRFPTLAAHHARTGALPRFAAHRASADFIAYPFNSRSALVGGADSMPLGSNARR